jgi:flagellar hook protein FlgE
MALDALYTGASGMTAFSTMLDVVGNNVSNINTPGYKDSEVSFQDLMYQTLNPGSPPSGNLGGTNPIQEGMGVSTGATDTNYSQGTITQTGNPLDAAIQGNGYFVLGTGANQLFTRDGQFSVNSQGFLVDPTTGELVQRTGTVGESLGFQVAGNDNISIPYGAAVAGTPTTSVNLQGNIDNSLTTGQSATSSIQYIDSQSAEHTLSVTFTNAGTNTYNVTASVDGTAETVTGGPVTFNTDGTIATGNSLTVSVVGTNGAANQTVTLDLGVAGSANGVTQFGTATTVQANSQNGVAAGTLESVSIDQNGNVQGLFTNGETIPIAQLALATFANQTGLLQVGNNDFAASASSGAAQIGVAGTGGNGTILGGALEGSNVNISTEFAQLIIAQRGFQVNAETVTIANQVLADLANVIQ